jgi:hypothetical protein
MVRTVKEGEGAEAGFPPSVGRPASHPSSRGTSREMALGIRMNSGSGCATRGTV